MHSAETKKKISEALKKKWKEKEFRNKNIRSLRKAAKKTETRKKHSGATKKSWSEGVYKNREGFKKTYRKTYLKSLKEKYPSFFMIDKPMINLKDLTIHVKCKTCGKLFEPSYSQLYERIRAIEQDIGIAENNLYCSEECKQKCSVYRKRNGGTNKKQYTESDYQIFRNFVLERDNYKCQYCGKEAEHVHHERAQKLEPFFALDPDLAWSVCKECHYKYGHQKNTECSIGNIANRMCQ